MQGLLMFFLSISQYAKFSAICYHGNKLLGVGGGGGGGGGIAPQNKAN